MRLRLFLPLLLAGWGEARAAAPARAVDVQLVGVLVSPAKSTGGNWDGTGILTSEAMKTLSGVIDTHTGTAGAASATTELLSLAEQGFAAPDVFGYAEVVQGGVASLRAKIATHENSYELGGLGIGWTGIPLDAGTRIRLGLADADPDATDTIGTVELNSADLLAALEEGRTYAIPVGAQSGGQIVYVRVSVFENAAAAAQAKQQRDLQAAQGQFAAALGALTATGPDEDTPAPTTYTEAAAPVRPPSGKGAVLVTLSGPESLAVDGKQVAVRWGRTESLALVDTGKHTFEIVIFDGDGARVCVVSVGEADVPDQGTIHLNPEAMFPGDCQ